MPDQLRIVRYSEAVPLLRNDDLCEFVAGPRLDDQAIAGVGHSEIDHVAFYAVLADVPSLIESTKAHGIAATSLASNLEGYSGRWHVYRIPGLDAAKRREIISLAMSITGPGYGWGTIALQTLLHFPFIRWLFWWLAKDKILRNSNGARMKTRDCTEFVQYVLRNCGVRVVQNIADRYVEPCHFATSGVPDYVLTLRED